MQSRYFVSISTFSFCSSIFFYSPAIFTPKIFSSVRLKPTPLSASRFPRRLSMAFIPMPPIMSLISTLQLLSKFTSRFDAMSGLMRLLIHGSLVAIPHGHLPVWQRWQTVQPIAIKAAVAMYTASAPSAMALKRQHCF